MELTPGDPDLVPVAESGDDSAASSAVLDAADLFDPRAQSVLWHLLALPPDTVDRVLELVAQDGYERRPLSADDRARECSAGSELVAVARVQTVDALHVSQERSRMAGVTARHGGAVALWRVLQSRT
ncbi:hypothetical protein [Tsukamurella soli]|uniref:Uncharacterized protein n=1 Tax=Tsukamurella soli TaxID=644556 RepID=A0ABP8JBY0_9ACTN